MANVKVAVRVRPLSKRERAEGREIIVDIEDRVAKVKKIKVDSRPESVWSTREKVVAFGFDYCYWSVDPEDPKYASQEMVFQDLGTMMLSSAFKGYNICLFAYGQTGSGKTYTMMGTPASIGLTPRICEGLFSREGASSKQSASCRVKVSFLEIYNERVRDLLRQPNHKKPYTLRVREHPETGPYVQGLSQHVVTDYKQVVELLEEGIANRITAATHVHEASSRSHAIFTIQYTQAIFENNLPSETASKINLVDLAGSERADPSYCRHRIAEGANINKSLVTLGIVISTLAQNSQMFSSCQSINSIASEVDTGRTDSFCGANIASCRHQAYIPYRDSILTWLLKDSLGGNSKTIMIATISPASCCYNETMSTLRYASNAKNIINKPRVNEDENVKLIRELREEIDRLKVMLISFEMRQISISQPENKLERNSSPSWSDDREGNLSELVLQNEIKIDQLTKDWTDRWINRKAIMEKYSVDINKKKAGVTIDSSLPHLMAMDDDILSTGVVLYHLREGTTKIGRSDSSQEQDIVLQGQWIQKDHCIVDNRHGVVTLQPLQGARCIVNGHEVAESVRLSQGALVVLGKAHKFRFNHPAEAALLRHKRSICETSSVVSYRSLEWLDLSGDFPSFFYSFCPGKTESNEQRDLAHEECQPKLKNDEVLQSREIQQQQQYVEELQQEIWDGQLKAEQELEHDQAIINQQIRENQQWLIDEEKHLAGQHQQRESAVQTEVRSYAEVGIQNILQLETGPSPSERSKKKLVQLELLQKYSLKKAERHLSQKKVKLHLERIVKKQKLLEAKKNLQQLEATCWIKKNNVKPPQFLNHDTNIEPWDCKCSRPGSSPGALQCRGNAFLKYQLPQSSFFLKRDPSWFSTSAHNYTCSKINLPRKSLSVEYLPRAVKELPRRNIHEEGDGCFPVQKQLIKKQKIYFRNKGIVGNNLNNTEEISDICKDNQTMDMSDNRLRQTRFQAQISKASASGSCKNKYETKTRKEGTEIKELGELNQHSEKHVEDNAVQEAGVTTQTDKRKKHQSSLPGISIKVLKKSSVHGKTSLQQLSRTAKDLKGDSGDKPSPEQHKLLKIAASAKSLNNININISLSHGERRWHSAEMLSDGISKTVPDPPAVGQGPEKIEFSDTDSTYSVDSLSCANSEILTEQVCHWEESAGIDMVELEGSESDDSQMSQDSLTEKENKLESQVIKDFPEVHQEPAKFCKDNNCQYLTQVANISTSGSLTVNERSFSLDSLSDAVGLSDPAEESKLESCNEVPAEVFWKWQTLQSDSVTSNSQNSLEICTETVRKSNALNLSKRSFYLDASPESGSVCEQTLKELKISFSRQRGTIDQESHIANENTPVLSDAWLSSNLKNKKRRPIITVPSSPDHSEFQVVQLQPVDKSNYWIKRDDLRQSAAELSFVSCYEKSHPVSREPNEIEMLHSSAAPSVPLPETRKYLEAETSEDSSSISLSAKSSSCGQAPTFPTKLGFYEDASSLTPNCQQPNGLSEEGSIREWRQTSSCLKSASESICSGISRDQDFKNNLLISGPNTPVLQKEETYINTNFEECLFRTIEKGDTNSDSDSCLWDSKIVEINPIDKLAFHPRDQFAILLQTSEAEKVSVQEPRDVLTESALEVPSCREVEEENVQDEANNSEFHTRGSLSEDHPSLKLEYSGNNVSQKALPALSAEKKEKSCEGSNYNMPSVSVNFVIDRSMCSNIDINEKKTNNSINDSCEKDEKFFPQFSSDMHFENTPRIEGVLEMRPCLMENSSRDTNPTTQKHTVHKEVDNSLVCDSFIQSSKTKASVSREQKRAVLHKYCNKNDCLGAKLHSDVPRTNTCKDSGNILGDYGYLSATASPQVRLYMDKEYNNPKERVDPRILTTSEGNQAECNSKTINSEELNKLVISIHKLESDIFEMKCSQNKSLLNYCTVECPKEAAETRRNSESSNLVQRPNSNHQKCYKNQSIMVPVVVEEKVQLTEVSKEDPCVSELSIRSESSIHISTVNLNESQGNRKQSCWPADMKIRPKSPVIPVSSSTLDFLDTCAEPVKNDTTVENILGSEPSVISSTMGCQQDTMLSYNREDEKVHTNNETGFKESLINCQKTVEVNGDINCSQRVDKEQRDAAKNEGCMNASLTGLEIDENIALLQENQTHNVLNCDSDNKGSKLDIGEIPETYFIASKLEEQDDEYYLPEIRLKEKESVNLWNHMSEMLKDGNCADSGDNKGSKLDIAEIPETYFIASKVEEQDDEHYLPEICLKEKESINFWNHMSEKLKYDDCGDSGDNRSIIKQFRISKVLKTEKEEEHSEENSGNPEQDIFQDQLLPVNKCSYCFPDSNALLSDITKEKELPPHVFSRNNTDIVDNLVPVNQRDALEHTNQDYSLSLIPVQRFLHHSADNPLLRVTNVNGENMNGNPITASDSEMPLSNNGSTEVLQYYETQIDSNVKFGPLSTVDREEADHSFSDDAMQNKYITFRPDQLSHICESVEDLMLNKTSQGSESEQSPKKMGTYSKSCIVECHKSLDYASVSNTQNKIISQKSLDYSVSHNVGMFHKEGKESECLLNSLNMPQEDDTTLDLLVSGKNSASVFIDKQEGMTVAVSSQNCFKNGVSQKELDSLVQGKQEAKCLVSKCIERDCKRNSEKVNDPVEDQAETTEILICRSTLDHLNSSASTPEHGETLADNFDKSLRENTRFLEDSASVHNMNSYTSDYSASQLNTSPMTVEDLYFEKSKYLNSEVFDFSISSASDYALQQKTNKSDKHSSDIQSTQDIYWNKKQGQDCFPECCCDQENFSLDSKTETKLQEGRLLSLHHLTQISSCETTTTPVCSMEGFSTCTLFKNASAPETPKPPGYSTCPVCGADASSQQDALLAKSGLPATFRGQESHLLSPLGLPDTSCTSSESSPKSSISHSEAQRPAPLHPAPSSSPSLATNQIQESQGRDSEILDQQLWASEIATFFLAKENECLLLSDTKSSSQRNLILDCNGIHNFKTEKIYDEAIHPEPWNIGLPQKSCLEDGDKIVSHILNSKYDLKREQGPPHLISNVGLVNVPATDKITCKMIKAKREFLMSDQLNTLFKNDSIPSRFLSINSSSTLQEEPSSTILNNNNIVFTSEKTKRNKKDIQWPDLQTHSLSAPMIATSIAECSSDISEVDFSVYPASKSLQELNMSIEPPSPTEDELYSTESLSELKINSVSIKCKPRFQKKSGPSPGNCREKFQGICSNPSPIHCLKAIAYSTDNPTDTEASKYSNNITSLHGYHISKNEELRYQIEETQEQDQTSKDSIHFNSSDINPYSHLWQQNDGCKIGWKHYVFGSASDVSGNPPPLRLDNQTVTRCSSVDNGLNSQPSPFHSHLSSYANAKTLSSTISSTEDLQGWERAREGFGTTQLNGHGKHDTNVYHDELETPAENCISISENVLPGMRNPQQSENNSTQVDEIVLIYPTESDVVPNKPQEMLVCERETQTESLTKHKRQKRHRRSYTDIPASNPEPSKSSFQESSSWSSMQNLSMHISQLLHNTSELLGNLSSQSMKDSAQNCHKAIEQKRSGMFDRCTQTTEDTGIQTDPSEHPQTTTEKSQINANMKNEPVNSQEVNVVMKLVRPDTVALPKERISGNKGGKLLSMPDIRSADVDTTEHLYMCQPTLNVHSRSSSEVPKMPLNISSASAVGFSSPKIYPVAASLYNSRLESSNAGARNPASCISLSPNCSQDKKPIDKISIPERRVIYCKNNLLVDRASSPILTLSASLISQQSMLDKSTSSFKGYDGQQVRSTEKSETGFKKRESDLQCDMDSWEPCVSTSSQTEVDCESTPLREYKDMEKVSGNVLEKSMTEDVSRKVTSKQKHRFMIDTHTAVHTERLYHSSSTLELSSQGEYIIDDHGEAISTDQSFHQIQATRRTGNESSSRDSEYSPSKKSLQKSLNKHHLPSCVKSDETQEYVVDSLSQPSHHTWRSQGCSFLKAEMSDMQDDDDINTGSDTGSECDTEILLNGNASLIKAHRFRSYSLRDLPMHNKFSNWCGVKGAPHSPLTSLTRSASDIHSQAERKPVNTRATEAEERSLLSERRAREIERLRKERAQVMSGVHLDMRQQPLTVELTEAKLIYGIGETDAQLRILQNGGGKDLTSVPVKQQLYERHKKSIEILRKQREERLRCLRRSRSLSPQKHLSLLQTLDSNQREMDLPSRRREYLQQLRQDVVENTRIQAPKPKTQPPSKIENLLRGYQRAREETKTEIARVRDKLRERAEQEKKHIRDQIHSQLHKEEAKLKTLVSTSTLHTDSTLSLSSGPTSGYNSSNTAIYAASILGKQEGQLCPEDREHSTEDARGRSAVRNYQLYVLGQQQKGSASETFPMTSSSTERSNHRYPRSLVISPSAFSASPMKEYEDLSKHVLANAIAEVMAICSNDLKNLYSGQAAAGWKFQCVEKDVLVYYKAFSSSATKHGFLGAGVINRPLRTVLCVLKDPSKRHLYDNTITTAQVHKKITSNIELVYVMSDVSMCYQKQPRDFCCIFVEAKEENRYVLAIQSIHEESMPRPCKDVVRGEILPSAWILEPGTLNGKDITKVIYMVQVDLGAPAIPARLLSSTAKQQPLVIARLARYLEA